MIIDDRVIFVHNPRTSGTATRRALLHGADPNANIPAPWNAPTAWTTNRKHVFAGTVRAEMPADEWERRFKFSIVRNPWDRLVSLYGLFRRPAGDGQQVKSRRNGRLKLGKLITACTHDSLSKCIPKADKIAFHEAAFALDFKPWLLDFCETYRWNACKYLDETRPMTRIQQVEWFDGMDRVFRFEVLDELHDCLSDLGYAVPLPENQTEHRPWEAYYDNETHDWVARVFADDIRRFGY